MRGHASVVGCPGYVGAQMTEPEPTPVTEDGEVIGPPPNPPTEDTPPPPPPVVEPVIPPAVSDDEEDDGDL